MIKRFKEYIKENIMNLPNIHSIRKNKKVGLTIPGDIVRECLIYFHNFNLIDDIGIIFELYKNKKIQNLINECIFEFESISIYPGRDIENLTIDIDFELLDEEDFIDILNKIQILMFKEDLKEERRKFYSSFENLDELQIPEEIENEPEIRRLREFKNLNI